MTIKTLFNPLIRSNEPELMKQEPDGWLERIYTDPKVLMLSSAQAMEFVTLFGFENINDASQHTYINQGVGKFIDDLDSLCRKSFSLASGIVSFHVHIIASENSLARAEAAMRGIYEEPDRFDVDTTYCHPGLHSNVEDTIERVGWLESRSGAFIFKDQRAFDGMCKGLNLTK